MNAYVDAFTDNRSKMDIMYVFKSYVPKKTQSDKETNNPLLFREYTLDLLLKNGTVTQFSEKLNTTEENVIQTIENMLNEMGYERNILLVRILGYIVYKFYKKTMNLVYFLEKPLIKLKQQMGNKPVIFLPTHRSYVDTTTITAICFERNIEIPAIVSGIDLSYMWLLSYILKCTGSIYMKRSFKDDPLYSTVFKTYIRTVIKESGVPFQFYIEGTRSRSGKSLIPKLGCLKIVIDLFNDNQLPDIILVPVTVQFDRVPEDELFANEVLGKSKPKESSMHFLKAWYNMEDNIYGNTYVNIGEPTSLRSYLEENKQIILDVLAHEIILSHRKNAVLTLFNLLATVLVSRIYNSNENQFKLSEVIEDIKQLKNLIRAFGTGTNVIEQDDDEMKELERHMKIHKSLVSLDDSLDTVCVHLSNKNQPTGESREYVSLIMLQYYANLCISFVIDAIVLISLLAKLQPINKDKLLRSYQFFRSIFKNEFVFHSHFEEQEFKKTIQMLNELNIISTDEISNIYLKCETSFQNLISNLLKPFQNGATFICELLLQNLNRKFSEKDLIKEIRQYIKSKIRFEGYQYSHVYSTSSDFISNFIASLAKMEVLNLENEFKTTSKQTVMYVCKESSVLTKISRFLNSYML